MQIKASDEDEECDEISYAQKVGKSGRNERDEDWISEDDFY
jgi:hypothetical protein